ncbi:MAG TPA: ATP-binding protein [Arenibaculum sp.]|nr:ATP-binding protein [Arenibaculum sp.]
MDMVETRHMRLRRELDYYRRECNDLGARLIRLQEEQSRAFREARRSRTVARIIRDAYGLIDGTDSSEALRDRLLQIVLESTQCDRAALLARRDGTDTFEILHALGFGENRPPARATLRDPPRFFHTSSSTLLSEQAHALIAVLQVPFVLWAYDPGSGMAMVVGNASEANVSRPFEPDDQEFIEGALSACIDVLYRKRLEMELQRAMAEAQAGRDAHANFLAGFSHELRTPLNAILGFSELIRDAGMGPLDGHYREYASGIHDSGTHLLTLISEILEFASLQSVGPAPLDEQPVDLAPFLAGLVQTLRPLGERAGVRIAVVSPDVPARLLADRRAVRQMLTNLIGNAVKFTPEGGRVEMSASLTGDGEVALRVADTGIGMTADQIPIALRPFGRVANAYTNAKGGSGLGLPICRSLLEQHGGRLLIDSSPGAGTAVSLVFPAGRSLPPAESTP